MAFVAFIGLLIASGCSDEGEAGATSAGSETNLDCRDRSGPVAGPLQHAWLTELAGVAQPHRVLHGVMRTAGQLAGPAIRPRQVERLQYLHDLPVRLHSFLTEDWHWSGDRQSNREEHRQRGCARQQRSARAEPRATNGQNRRPRAGSFVTAYGQSLMAADTGVRMVRS